MTTVAIHQPQYLPWMPYFQKLSQADCFVFLDNVQYQSRGLQNRNQVKGPNGAVWLTVPVKSNRGDLDASSLTVSGSKQEMIIDICREVNATVYLSGCGAKDYQSSNNFENHGISLRYHDSVLPTYDQCFARQGFVPGMSALDTVLNLGEDAAQYL